MTLSININGQDFEVTGSDSLATEETLRSLYEAYMLGNKIKEKDRKKIEENAKKVEESLGKAAAASEDLNEAEQEQLRQSKKSGSSIKDRIGSIMSGFSPLSILGSIVGALVTVVSASIGSMQKLNASIKEVNAAGARFGGNLSDFANYAGQAGMGLDEFTKLISQNVGAIARLGGGSIRQGAQAIAALAMKATMGAGGLAGLGVSTNEAAQYMIDLSDQTYRMSRINIFAAKAGESRTQVEDRVAKSTRKYVEDLDKLAASTGTTREAMNNFVKESSKDPDLLVSLYGLTDEATQAIMKASGVFSALPGGNVLNSAMKDILSYGQVVNEQIANAMYQFGGGEFAQMFTQMILDMKNGRMTAEQFATEGSQRLAKFGNVMKANLQKLGYDLRSPEANQVISAITQMGQYLQAAADSEKKAIDDYMRANPLKSAALNMDRKKIKEQMQESSEIITKMNIALNQISSMFSVVLAKIFESPVVSRAIETLSTLVGEFSSKFLKSIEKETTLTGIIGKFFKVLGDTMLPIIQPFLDKILSLFYSAFAELFDLIPVYGMGARAESLRQKSISLETGNIKDEDVRAELARIKSQERLIQQQLEEARSEYQKAKTPISGATFNLREGSGAATETPEQLENRKKQIKRLESELDFRQKQRQAIIDSIKPEDLKSTTPNTTWVNPPVTGETPNAGNQNPSATYAPEPAAEKTNENQNSAAATTSYNSRLIENQSSNAANNQEQLAYKTVTLLEKLVAFEQIKDNQRTVEGIARERSVLRANA